MWVLFQLTGIRDGTKNKKLPLPKTFVKGGKNFRNKPRWLQDQRNSRHGVDFAYNLPDFNLNAYYTRYCETLLAIDENLGRLFDLLEKKGLLESTLVVYMGDNGFQFGEQGLIDKRTAYEASMRIPFLMHCPDVIQAGSAIKKVVANIDVGPTLLETAGLPTPKHMMDAVSGNWPRVTTSRGETMCSTSIFGIVTIRTRRRHTPCVGSVSNISVTTGSGTRMSCTTFSTIRTKQPISFSSRSTKKP
jgi:hypothetical protein